MDDKKKREELIKQLEKIKKEAEKFVNGVERVINTITKSEKKKDREKPDAK